MKVNLYDRVLKIEGILGEGKEIVVPLSLLPETYYFIPEKRLKTDEEELLSCHHRSSSFERYEGSGEGFGIKVNYRCRC